MKVGNCPASRFSFKVCSRLLAAGITERSLNIYCEQVSRGFTHNGRAAPRCNLIVCSHYAKHRPIKGLRVSRSEDMYTTFFELYPF